MTEIPLRSHSRTDPGLVHHKNEDQVGVFDTPGGGRVLLVCDGMGGMGRGDEASRIALAAVKASLQVPESAEPPDSPAERLVRALQAADDKVREELYLPHQMAQPGSTAVMVHVKDGEATVCWVGDSRAYLIRDDHVVARTRDHKLVEDLVDAGQMTEADARHSTLAHVVTRALGGKTPEEPTVTPQALPHPWRLRHGDRLLVCSDGLTDLVEDSELPALVMDGEPEAVSQRLVEVANERGGHDNITCVVAVWDGPDTHPVTEPAPPPEPAPPAEPPSAPEPEPLPEPADMAALARELGPWWIATALLLVGAFVFAIVAATRG